MRNTLHRLHSAARARGACVALGLGTILCFTGCEEGGPGARDASQESDLVGRHAPPFDLPAQSGSERVSLSASSGRVLLLDFWATWCAPCKESFPHYQALLDEFDGQLEIVGISVDDEPDQIAQFAKETGVSFPLAWDRDKGIAHAYEPQAMPTSYLIDQNGIVRRIHAGYHPGDEKKLAGEIRHLLE